MPSMRSAVRLRGQSAQLADHDQVLQAGEMRVQMRLFRHVAHALFIGDQVALNALALEKDLARGHLHQPGDHFHGGGFAGTVRPQVPGDLPGAREKLTSSTASDAAESLRDMAKFEHGLHPM